MDKDHDLVRIAMFDSEPEAKILQIALIDRGIKATISGDVSAFGATGAAIGVRVFVRRIEVDEAKKLIVEMEQEIPVPEWSCKCGETVDEGYALCWSCGSEHPSFETDEF